MTTPISGAPGGTALAARKRAITAVPIPGSRIDRVAVGNTCDGSKPGAGAAGRRKAIDEAARDIGHAWPFVEREQLDARSVGIGELIDSDQAVAGMLQKVGRHLGGDERDPRLDILGEAFAVREARRRPPRLADLARIAH